MINNFESISGLGVFSNFTWKNTVVNKQNKALQFKDVNIIYGQNYSGKTTLSRMVRSLETGQISEKYGAPKFKIVFEDKTYVTENSLSDHGHTVRVFNEDFIRENLNFIRDSDSDIKSFAILGSDNNRLLSEISELKSKRGDDSLDTPTALHLELKGATTSLHQQTERLASETKDLEKTLSQKATSKENGGIKYQSEKYGDQNYTITKLKTDLNVVLNSDYVPLTSERREELLKTTEDRLLPEVVLLPPLRPQLSKFIARGKSLTEFELTQSDKISRLLQDAALNRWAQEGLKIHSGCHDECAFCGHRLTESRWAALETHFDAESKNFECRIETLISEIDAEKKLLEDYLIPKKSQFYASFHAQLNDLSQRYRELVSSYLAVLNDLKSQLVTRKNTLFSPIQFTLRDGDSEKLSEALRDIQKLITASNMRGHNIETTKREAQNELRLDAVHCFQREIEYSKWLVKIAELDASKGEAEKEHRRIKAAIDEIDVEILSLNSRLHDEVLGAERINQLLNHFYGISHFSLKAVDDVSAAYGKKQIRFEVMRDNKKAYYLSEGEQSLLAFCYFLARLDDTRTKEESPIVWVDDPISSLDSNHIFFIFSLIDSELVRSRRCKQLFISTHSLDFLKYMQRLSTKKTKGERELQKESFTISRKLKVSEIKRMPDYLKNFASEFRTLFRTIDACARIEDVDDENYHLIYNFPNDARKFLEVYLHYKYPDNRTENERYESFFGADNVPSILMNRIVNEYSHLRAAFERGRSIPNDAEIRRAAQQIIEILKNDEEQYKAFKTGNLTEE